jgi:hypothetical protein
VIDPSEVSVAQVRIRRQVDYPVVRLFSFRVSRQAIIKVAQYEMEVPIVRAEFKGFLIESLGLFPVAPGLFYIGKPAIRSCVERIENQRLVQFGSGED